MLKRLVLACAVALAPSILSAQDLGVVQSDILVLDTDRLFKQTLLGRRILSEYDAERDAVIAENQRIDAELTAEEKALTEQRPDMTPDDFRAAADAFDAKVQTIRRENEAKALELERRRDTAPLLFLRTVRPVLSQLMRDSGAVVILEPRAALLWADVVDITPIAIERVDAEIGDGRPDTDANDAQDPANGSE